MDEIKRAAVIGAGVMGAAIAAHLANAGIPVVLMDVVPQGTTGAGGNQNRNAIAEGAMQRILKSEPAPFMSKKAASLVEIANVEDHLDRAGSADWIIEAVVEDVETKRALYRRLEQVRKDGSIVSSNTSTIPLATLLQGLPERLCRDFLIAHFFNPPRYMRLLELVAGPRTRSEVLAAIEELTDRRLGKVAIHCHDRPGFVANRIGAFWLQCALGAAADLGLTVEEADAVTRRSLGVPGTGIFGLLDLVGLDLMLKIDSSLTRSLDPGDAYRRIRRDLPLIARMVSEGRTGRKGTGGFYRLRDEGKDRVREAMDLATGQYRPVTRPLLESLVLEQKAGLRGMVEHPDKGGRFAWSVLSETLTYAASLVPEATDDIHAIDLAMQLGYQWQLGPFELMDRLGPAYLAKRLQEQGQAPPALLQKAAATGAFYRVEGGRRQFLDLDGSYGNLPARKGICLLSDLKLAGNPLARNSSASLWDVGDGVVCLEVHSKMNTVDLDVFAMIRNAIDTVAGGYKALVLYNEGEHFSAGVNLGLALFAANVAAWPLLEDLVRQGQEIYKALKYAPFPVVGAPSGLAIGGGCEMLLHCDAVQAHTESYIGLVETGVGVVPAWGGCKEMLARLGKSRHLPAGPVPAVARVFETIGFAKVARSAFEAKELGFLRARDGITFNRDRLLADAKARALELTAGYRPPEPPTFILPGPSGRAALALVVETLRSSGQITAYDAVVATALAGVLCGGETADPTVSMSEDEVLVLERAAFMLLIKNEATLARIEHTLETGKPLRN
ncbi:MAG TPA: 3-hydroxyacyl-CoA dehydrogenase/enoyl-CoA hydratase family protein [Candidatus Binatia bacterium]